jgi:uncharacterized protein YbjT (DUF2867 family)
MIFVTGASGNVGREVVRELKKLKIEFRVGVRASDQNTRAVNTNSVIFDFLDHNTFSTAVEGCKAVFLLRPPAISNTKATLNVFIDVARRSGVKHIVFISVAGAARNRLVPHHAVEQHLIAGPVDWTILRPGFFTQNLGDAYREDICHDNRIFLPAGSARVAFIDARDIAAVAVTALCNPAEHSGKAYKLTGPQALSFAEVAAILSDHLSRAITYRPASILGYMWHLLARRMPITQILVQTILHVGLRFGQAEDVDDTLLYLLKRKPCSVREYVRDHRTLWNQSSCNAL